MVDENSFANDDIGSDTKVVQLHSRRVPKSEIYSITGGVVKVVAPSSSLASKHCSNSDQILEDVKKLERRTTSFLDALMPLMQRVIARMHVDEVRNQLVEQLSKENPEGLFRDSAVRCIFLDECVHNAFLLREDQELFKTLCAQFKFPSSSVCRKAAQVLRRLLPLTEWQAGHLCMLSYEMFLYNSERRLCDSEKGVARIFAQLDDSADHYQRALVSQREFGYLGTYEALNAFATIVDRQYLQCMIEGTEHDVLRELYEKSTLELDTALDIDTYTRFCACVLKNSRFGEQIVFELTQPDLA
jgi:hypothetical protein